MRDHAAAVVGLVGGPISAVALGQGMEHGVVRVALRSADVFVRW